MSGHLAERTREDILGIVQCSEGLLHLSEGDQLPALGHFEPSFLQLQREPGLQGEQRLQLGRPLHEAVEGHGAQRSREGLDELHALSHVPGFQGLAAVAQGGLLLVDLELQLLSEEQ
ncbi:hypothetical protein DSECCO2_584920 [anaerobic digester metagenome]